RGDPLDRIGRAEELAHAAHFLASNEGSCQRNRPADRRRSGPGVAPGAGEVADGAPGRVRSRESGIGTDGLTTLSTCGGCQASAGSDPGAYCIRSGWAGEARRRIGSGVSTAWAWRRAGDPERITQPRSSGDQILLWRLVSVLQA